MAAEERAPAVVFASRTGAYVACVHQRYTCDQAHRARPTVRLGDLTIDARNLSSTYHMQGLVPVWFDALDIFDVSGQEPVLCAQVASQLLSPIGFSPDGRYFAFVSIGDSQLTLSWIESGDDRVQTAPGVPVSGALIAAAIPLATWAGDRTLVCRATVATVAGPERLPRTCETSPGQAFSGRLYYRLLRGEDERQLTTVLTTQLARVALDAGEVTRIGDSGLYERISSSPDGRYILASRIVPAFDDYVGISELKRTTEVLTGGGMHVSILEDASAVPVRLGKDAARRRWSWHPFAPATTVAVVRRDDVRRVQCTEFDGDGVAELFATEAAIVRLAWTTRGSLLVWERPQASGSLSLVRIDPQGRSRRVTACARLQDAPELTSGDGERPLWCDGGDQALAVETAGGLLIADLDSNDRGEDALSLYEIAEDGATRRAIPAPAHTFEPPLAVLDASGSRRLILRDAPHLPYRFEIDDDAAPGPILLTESRRDPSPESTARRWVTRYAARLGVETVASVYLPDGASAASPAPCVVWVHPHVADSPTVGRYRPRINRYLRSDTTSPLLLLRHGYAVVTGRLMPVASTQGGTASSVVDELLADTEGLMAMLASVREIDASRVVVMGTCFGAWTVAVLLANTDRFRAGVARSGFFSPGLHELQHWFSGRTGDLSELIRASPLLNATRIRTPLLILHGEHEGPPVNAAAESQSLFAHVAAAGGCVRYVSLPYEGHWCASDPGIGFLTEETLSWCNRHTAVGANTYAV